MIDETRVAQIASLLDDQPLILGPRITERTAWDTLADSPGGRAIIAEAECVAGEPFQPPADDLYLEYSRTGDRTNYQDVATENRHRMAALFLAECLENKGRFVAPLCRSIEGTCRERTWIVPAHDDADLSAFHGAKGYIDLFSAEQAWALAAIPGVMDDLLPDDTRELLISEVMRRVIDVYRHAHDEKTVRPMYWLTCNTNWNAVCHAGVVGAALCLVTDRSDRAMFIASWEQHIPEFLSGFTSDGCCTEGLGYWGYGFGHYCLLAQMIARATHGVIDFMDIPFVRDSIAFFGRRMEIANGVYAAFADCPVAVKPRAELMAYLSRRYGLGWRAWEEQVYGLQRTHITHGIGSRLLFMFPDRATTVRPAQTEQAALPPRDWFDQSCVLIARPGASAARLAAAMKGGHNGEIHNHNDLGSYIVVADEHRVLCDPGAEIYTKRTFGPRRYDSVVLNSYGHPVPVIAGQLQKEGSGHAARVLRTAFTDDVDELVIDLRAGYDVPSLERLVRTFTYDRRGAGRFTVRDTAAFSSPESFETALITLGTWRQIAPDTLLVEADGAGVTVTIDTNGAPFDVKAERLNENLPPDVEPTRIAILLRHPVTNADITLTITPHGSAAEMRTGHEARAAAA